MVVGNLGKRGLVSRQRLVSDKRVVTVHLTDAGRQLIEAVLPIHFKATTAEADRLSPEEQAELVKICRKLRLADNRERIS
jgi:MarR family 2-MHQ and catechol resistance regulon transcriptional repressor